MGFDPGFDTKKVQDFVKKNSVLVASYAVVIGCAVGAYYVNQGAQKELKGLRTKLKTNAGKLKELSEMPALKLPTQRVHADWEAKIKLYEKEDKEVRAIYDRADKPLEEWFSEEAKNTTAVFATAYREERTKLIEQHQAILPEELPRTFQERNIDRDTDTREIQKQFWIMKRILDAAASSEVELIETLDFKKPIAPVIPEGTTPEISITRLPVNIAVQIRFPKVNAFIANLLASDIPFVLEKVSVSKREFQSIDLYAHLESGERPDPTKLKMDPVPNESQPKPYYDDLTYTIEIDQEEWTEDLVDKLLPEPPVLVRLELRALDFEVTEPVEPE